MFVYKDVRLFMCLFWNYGNNAWLMFEFLLYIYTGHLIGCKKIKLCRNFREYYAQKCVDYVGKGKRWIMQKFEQLVELRLIPWALQYTGCTVNTMDTSILPRILALYGKNKHTCNFRQVWDLFLAIVDRYSFNTIFPSNFAKKKNRHVHVFVVFLETFKA